MVTNGCTTSLFNYSLNADDVIQINFTYYNNYSNNELTDAIKYALVKLSANYSTFIFNNSVINPEPTVEEQNLIALVASILLKGDYRSIRLPDMSLLTNEKLSKDEQIDKLVMKFKHNSGLFSLWQTY